MAVAVPTNITKSGSAATASSYATASVSLVKDRLYILTVFNNRSTSASAIEPTVSGAGQTWDRIVTFQDTVTGRRRLTMFRCMPTANASGVLTIDMAAQTQNMCDWVLDEFTGTAIDATNGSTAITLSPVGSEATSAVTSHNHTLGGSGSGLSTHGSYGAIIVEAAGSPVVKESGSFTETQNAATVSGSFIFATQFIAITQAALSWTMASAIVRDALAIEILAAVDKAASDTGVGADSSTLEVQVTTTDSSTGSDLVDTLAREYGDTSSGSDLLSQLERDHSDSGSGDDSGGLTFTVDTSDVGVGVDTSFITVEPKTGHFHIGKFQTGEALYTIENEIIDYEQIDAGSSRVNVVVVDGNDDSWTEYDRDDLIQRDIAINKYLDLPELKTPGEVRQRAIEELQLAQRRNSPGGTAVWMRWFTKGDNVYWVDEDHNKYETRIEGLSIEWNQSLTPYQRASVDTGILVFCPPDQEEGAFLARDLFNRDTVEGLGTALIGGSWNIYTE